MNKLARDKRVQIIRALVDGASMRATSRIADVSYNAVNKLLIDAGKACSDYQDKAFRNLTCKRLQLDEIWAFVGCKAANVAAERKGEFGIGDVWTWTAIDADTKLMPSWLVSDRSGAAARQFVCDLASRLANRVQVTTDGHRAYLEAVEAGFGAAVDYAQLVKLYGQADEGQRRYSPPQIVGTETHCCTGAPDPAHISTSFAERANLTMRMSMRRFTRLTNGFSKKVEHHAYAVALHFMYYNFARIHKSLRITPAMAAGVTGRLWSIEDIVDMLDAAEEAPKRPKTYRKRQAAA